jgi:metallo-beta-lactamase family protein
MLDILNQAADRPPPGNVASNTTLTFLGGTGTVTGSKYLLELPSARILVDCGLFQGYKNLRLRNWEPFPIDPASLSAVFLTHAHLDHSGYLPVLVRNGFKGRIFCTAATADLCRLLLPDSGFIQEKDAEFANRHGFSKHHPALPLYTRAEAERVMAQLGPVAFDRTYQIGGGVSATFRSAGHILGAATIEFAINDKRVVFSGDLGRSNSSTMPSPSAVPHADYLVVESTYGNRKHERRSPEDVLADLIVRTARRGGTVLIASFAVGRAQTLLHHLHRLKAARRIPNIPIFLDSPMAVDATEIYLRHVDNQRLTPAECREAFACATYVREVEESKRLDHDQMPKIILSSSGMATGGRILHHLKSYAPDPRNTVVFTGFQAGGTRGADMLAGADSVKIHGQMIPVRAEIANLSMLSAHADAEEILEWLSHFDRAPRMTFITHGDPPAAEALRDKIQTRLGWPVTVPKHQESIPLL